jgi:hypothetical protein
MGLVLATLATTLVIVYASRSGGHEETLAVSADAPFSAAPVTPAALNGEYDVSLRVASAEYGATWPSPLLTVGQTIAQRWSIDCRAASCRVRITTGHVVEDPGDATVTTDDDRVFTASATAPASADSAGLPAGCGQVNATDVQRLALTTGDGGSTFAGTYDVHHPVTHVEGPVGDGQGTCDSFNLAFTITATRRSS